MSKKKPSLMGETARTVIFAVIIAFFIRVFAYEPFNIPSGSMVPTLLVGDYLFVSKFSYGYSRYSFELLGIPLVPFKIGGDDGRVLSDPPERGDVVVFRLPRDNKIDYIKRVIGLPGDRIQVLGGILHINGKAVVRRKQGAVVRNGYVQATEYLETLPNGVEHRIWEESDEKSCDDTPVYVVPPRHYFMMGDNRDNSLDSRVYRKSGSYSSCPGQRDTQITIDSPVTWEVGFVPFENLIGRAEFLFFSHETSASMLKPWTWPTGIRFRRFFNGVE